MTHRAMAALGAAAVLALSSQASGSTAHVHFCDCGHPQGRIACGGGSSGIATGDGQERQTNQRLKTASHGAALIATGRNLSADGYAEPPRIEEPVNTMKIRLSVLAILLPCVFALGLLFLGAMSRRG